MKVITGRVVSGKIEFEADLPDGVPVAILAADDTSFHLNAEEEEELVEALEDIRRGHYVDGRALLQDLRGSGGR